VPLSGVTGIASWEDAVKYILLGASTVQVCAALYAKGYRLIKEIDEGIHGFMERHGYECIDDFRGKLLGEIRTPEEISDNPHIKAEIDGDKCTGCEVCEDSCFFGAITMQDGKAFVIQEVCDGCGICTMVCPVDAPKMIQIG